MTKLQQKSIALGLIESKFNTPNLHEMELARHPHKWKEVRKLQRDLFRAFIAEVEEREIDILKVLNLPDINKVRHAEIDNDETGEGKFKLSDRDKKSLKAIFEIWKEELVGTKNRKQVGETEATYPYYLLSAYSVGLDKYRLQTEEALPQGALKIK
jgi:hypothetical protein